MRRAVTPAIPVSMYRHFAIITLLLTTGLAMFADGENREAQAAQVVHRAPPKAAAPAAFATASPTPAAEQSGGWGADDLDNSFGKPMEGLLGGASGIIPDLDDVIAPGYSPEYLASLSEEERRMLLPGLQENGMLEPEIQSQRSAAISAASRRRSGASSRGD